MKPTPYIIFLFTSGCIVRSSIISDVKDNVLSFIQRSIANYEYPGHNTEGKQNDRIDRNQVSNKNYLDIERAQAKSQIMKRAKESKGYSSEQIPKVASQNWQVGKTVKERYRKDPVLNFLSRRKAKYKNDILSEDSSSSREMREWKDEWREHWIQKKFEAINSTQPVGDTVNMLAARPWGVPCGDPNQHDMPWGSCMLPMECEPEYRIFRGDYFCGRTQFVCCALQLTTYDMYQGFDLSFADSDMQTDSEEKRIRLMGSKEAKRRKKLREKRRRSRARQKRKRKIKRNIKKIIREIRKILSRTYRNGTAARKKKTKELKKFVKALKRQYKKDRKSVKNIHEIELMKIDHKLQQKLDQIKGMNQNFIRNYTFRDIVVNGTVSPKVVKTLVQAYPELAEMLDAARRSNVDKPDYLEYDLEYGMLYY